MMRAILLLIGLLAAATTWAQTPRVLTLAEALTLAAQHHPDLRQARAGTEAGKARVDQARAPLLPQVSGTASYKRSTANFAPSPGSVPKSVTSSATANFDTYNYFAVGASASQLVYDFGQTSGKLQAALAQARATGAGEQTARVRILAGVRIAYFAAQAQHALLQVATSTLENQERHLAQIQAFVEVGRRPAIDLAQARADRANAELQRINAEANDETARAQLLGAIGLTEPMEVTLGAETMPAVPGEDAKTESLLADALAARPDIAALNLQLEAQDRTIAALRATYAPAVLLSTGLTDAGTQLSGLAWNWQATLGLSWPVFQGGLTDAQLREARANRSAIEAQIAGVSLQVRVDVEQARLAVRASRLALGAADEALSNAKVRLELAEGRYKAGAGSIIELADAQLGFTTASAQRVQADFKLATARAQLLAALGRD